MRKKLLVNALRIVISAALLYYAYTLIHFEDVYVVRSGGLRREVKEVRDEGTHWVLVDHGSEQRLPKEGTEVRLQEGFLSLFRRIDRAKYALFGSLLLLPFVVLSYRWYLLLRAHEFPVTFRSALAVTYIGGFFNNFLPGSVGGDLARAMIAGKGEERKAALVGTILLDRVIGLGSMVVIAAICLVPFVRDPSMRDPLKIVGLMLGLMLVGYLVYFNRGIRKMEFVQGLKTKGRFGEIVRDLDGTLKLLKHKKGVVVQCMLLSFVGQSIAIFATWGIAQALGVTSAKLFQFFVFEPIIFIITAVPISAGGWGVQENAYKTLFGMAGVPANEAIAISVLYKLTLILVSLPGGILWALGFSRKRRESGAGAQVGGAAGDVPAHE